MNSKKHYQQNSVSQIRELIDSGKATEALKSLQQMITSAPENAELYYLLGDAYYQKEKWNDAHQAYLKAVNLQPNMAQASIGFGDASVELKAYEEADKAYKHALQQDPSLVKQLALCYKLMGDALATDLQGKASYVSYKNALELDSDLLPEIQTSFIALSGALHQAGKLEDAQQAQTQAECLTQELEGSRLLQEGKANEALSLLEAAVSVETGRATLHYQIGEAYYQLKEWKIAGKSYLNALNLKGDMIEAALKFAEVSIELQIYDQAEKALTYALGKNPETNNRVAQLYKRIGDGFATESMGEQAREAYQKALALDATLSTDVLTSLFEVLENRNSFGVGSAASSEENELLLLQLHQVQEELEQYFFRNQSLESKLQEVKKQEKIDKNIATSLNQQFSKLSARLENLLRIEAYFATGKVIPALHDWAISPDLAFFIINLIESERYNLIIEFGSGSSTVIIANVLERLKRSSPNDDKSAIRQVAFEHSKEYYKKTLGLLTQAGLSSDVQLVYSPLGDYKADNGCVYSYYDICYEIFSQLSESNLSRNARILVLIDGPPGSTGKHVRYPALPIINQYFKHMSVDFLLDDYNRDEEKEIVEMWKNDLENASREFYLEEYSFEKGACLIRLSS